MEILGVDVGGSGIKGAPVDTLTGTLLAERQRIATPEGAEPEAVAAVLAELTRQFNWKGPVGVGFPAVVRSNIVRTASNISKNWIGVNAPELFSKATGLPVSVVNDADAAGMAEVRFGAGKDRQGTVLMITLGTGIGSALFHNGMLVPNTEFGHIEVRGYNAESRTSDAARQRDELNWKKWAKRLNQYFERIQLYLQPDLIIIGGGVSKKFDKFGPLLKVDCEMVPAQFLNEAGIVGAALAAEPKP